jgi:hypothetical protein
MFSPIFDAIITVSLFENMESSLVIVGRTTKEGRTKNGSEKTAS